MPQSAPIRPDATRARYEALLEVAEFIGVRRQLSALFADLSRCLKPLVLFDFIALTLLDESQRVVRLHILETDHPAPASPAPVPFDDTPTVLALETRKPYYTPDLASETRFPVIREMLTPFGVQSICTFPLFTAQRDLGSLNFGSLHKDAYQPEDIEFMQLVARQVAVAVDNALSYERIEELNARLAEEKVYLEDEIRTDSRFEEIIGQSRALKVILKQVETVAPTDSTVLICGETGTGKELLARAIHDLSSRRGGTFVKLNCAAIPTGLLESEMFGHEKGAFTGAIAQRIGRFELAHRGTMFLDEVGEIPLELQTKLLRVLQEREFERLGSSRTIRTDARLVAATNRDLAALVEERQFRADLYYRLNVFPITAPPLRERREDIPLLVRYFVQQNARRMNKRITAIPAETMQALTHYHWPGNIRELQNFIERAVILSPDRKLEAPLRELKRPKAPPAAGAAPTLAQAEREAIVRALRDSGGRVAGATGAAARLGMKRTTLQAKMRKLGVDPRNG
jgi:formate hydrogenlyase transcriptional activator